MTAFIILIYCKPNSWTTVHAKSKSVEFNR